jgi:glycosyltransferase involved in cell wall biosynthesis
MRPLTFLTLSTTDWDAHQFGSRQAIAASLARRGHRVFFVEVPRALHSFISDPAGTVRALRRVGTKREVQKNLFVYTPRPVLPVYYHPWTNGLNQRLLRRDLRRALERLNWVADVLWTYWPNTSSLVGGFGEQISVYHCIDDFKAVSYPLVRDGVLATMEAELCRRVDLVLAGSPGLRDDKLRFNSRTELLASGVDQAFLAAGTAVEPDPSIAMLPAPRVGFVGTIDDRIDAELVAASARALSQATFVLIGPVKRHRFSTTALAGLPNVRLLGPRPHGQIPAALAAFDVAIIPYRRNAFTESLSPAKLYEYLAAGIPTVTIDLPFAQPLRSHLRIAKDTEDFIAALRDLIDCPPAAESRRRWRAAARKNSWEQRVDTIEALLLERLNEVR